MPLSVLKSHSQFVACARDEMDGGHDGARAHYHRAAVVRNLRASRLVSGCERCFDVGVLFVSAEDAFSVGMVEQICHIGHYRRHVRKREGRQVDGDEAAQEWVSKYAADFANPQ
jgi:hypothetical protein